MTLLTQNINQIVSLTTEEKSAIEKAYSTIEIAKGDLWVQQGKICDQVGFLVSGKLRNFYIDKTGNEVTCYFVSPENFISSFTSFLTNTPANENISALEDSVLRVISKKDLEELGEHVPKMQIIFFCLCASIDRCSKNSTLDRKMNNLSISRVWLTYGVV